MRIVVALGGNALLQRGELLSAENQSKNIATAVKALVPLAKDHQLIICHGNGPQVGLLALEEENYHEVPSYPLDILVAETQAMIGYPLQQCFSQLIDQPVVTVLTQVEVDKNDLAMKQPSKPIGPVYNRQQAAQLQAKYQWTMKQDGENMRRVVPSPAPKSIIEITAIRQLVETGSVVICGGGGGIPVYREQDHWRGLEAVVDKDHTAALLAACLQADVLLILTDVDAVYDHWQDAKTRQAIKLASISEIEHYQFSAGSMSPKVSAACEFVSQNGKYAAIGNLAQASDILAGSHGTKIVKNHSHGQIIFHH